MLAAATAVSAVRLSRGSQPAFIPRTDMPMPPDFEDYARGRRPWRLFPGDAPGMRAVMKPAGEGLPAFDPGSPADHPEVFVEPTRKDRIGARCAPGGLAAGHYIYNVWDPEVVPFVVNRSQANRLDAAVVIAPGGGGIHLSWEPEGISPAEWLNGMGISAFVLKYRVPVQDAAKAPLKDAQRAVALVRSRAREFGLNPDKIGFMGSSFGGLIGVHLAMQDVKQYPAVDSSDEFSSMPNFMLLLYPAIPVNNLSLKRLKHLPPTFLAYTKDDPCCPVKAQQIFLKMAAIAKSVPVEPVQFPSGKHGWGDCNFYPQLKGQPMCNWRELAEKFIKTRALPA